MSSVIKSPIYFPGATTSAGKGGKASVVHLTTAPESPGLFILTFTGGETPDNRLSHLFLQGYLEALEYVETRWTDHISSGDDKDVETSAGAALVTTGQIAKGSKFFSNGLDFEKAIADPNFFDTHLFTVYAKLLSFPIPTIAAIGGHCFAAGWGLANAHDYRVMNGRRGFLCMNEIFFGAQLPGGLLAALQSKIQNPVTMRRIVLEGTRFGGPEALKLHLVDHLAPAPAASGASNEDKKSEGGGAAETLQHAIELAKKMRKLAAKDCWGSNKLVLYAPYLDILKTKFADYHSKL